VHVILALGLIKKFMISQFFLKYNILINNGNERNVKQSMIRRPNWLTNYNTPFKNLAFE